MKRRKYCGDENITKGLVTPRERIYSPSLNKGNKKMSSKMKKKMRG